MGALSQLKSVVAKTTPPTPSKKETPKQQEQALQQKPLTNKEKLAVLDAVGKQLDKQFTTTNSLVRLGKKLGVAMPHRPMGIPSIDYGVYGIGGTPDGRIIEIFGPESAGKTTIALQLVAAEQEAGELAAFVDAEHALDPNYAKQLGVDVDNLVVSQPDSGEQALETVEALVKSRAVSIVVIDSVAALTPQAELDGEMGDSHMGLQARLMSQAMRKLRGIAAVNGVKLIFINQIRDKIGVMFGSPETTTGGKALKFYSSIRLDVRRVGGDAGKVKSGEVVIGHVMKLKAVKNKVAAPFKETLVDLIYGKGIDKFADTIRFAITVGAIEKAGAWYSFAGERLGQGEKNVIDTIRGNDVLFKKIQTEIGKAIKAQQEADAQ